MSTTSATDSPQPRDTASPITITRHHTTHLRSLHSSHAQCSNQQPTPRETKQRPTPTSRLPPSSVPFTSSRHQSPLRASHFYLAPTNQPTTHHPITSTLPLPSVSSSWRSSSGAHTDRPLSLCTCTPRTRRDRDRAPPAHSCVHTYTAADACDTIRPSLRSSLDLFESTGVLAAASGAAH